MAGLNTDINGFPFSEGMGMNGNVVEDGILEGLPTTNGGYASLFDDSFSMEFSPDQWTVDFKSAIDITEAEFHICTELCEEYRFAIAVQDEAIYLPVLIR